MCGRDRRILGTHWPDILAKMVSVQASKRPHLTALRWRVTEADTQCPALGSACVPICTVMDHVHAPHVYIPQYKYIERNGGFLKHEF